MKKIVRKNMIKHIRKKYFVKYKFSKKKLLNRKRFLNMEALQRRILALI